MWLFAVTQIGPQNSTALWLESNSTDVTSFQYRNDPSPMAYRIYSHCDDTSFYINEDLLSYIHWELWAVTIFYAIIINKATSLSMECLGKF